MDVETIRALQIIGYYVAIYLLSAALSAVTIGPFVNRLVRTDLKDDVDPGESRLSNYVGILERFMYTTAILIGKPEFIGVWLVVKVVQQRPSSAHNVFLIGSALSLIWGAATALVIQQFLPPFPSVPAWKLPTV